MIDVENATDLLRNRTIRSQDAVPFDGKYLDPSALAAAPRPDMSLLDAIMTRRTSRHYADEPVPFALFRELIEVATWAPSSCNEQRWKIIYIDDREILDDLYWRGSAAFLRKVDQAFLVLYNNRTDNTKYQDHVQSGAALITTFSLIAHSVGVGSCWIGHIPPKRELRRMFGIDRRFDPIALVSFGFYRHRVKPRQRKQEAGGMISRNEFDFENLQFQTSKNIFARRILIKLYYWIPAFLRRRIRHWTLPYERKFYDEVAD